MKQRNLIVKKKNHKLNPEVIFTRRTVSVYKQVSCAACEGRGESYLDKPGEQDGALISTVQLVPVILDKLPGEVAAGGTRTTNLSL